jgi:CRISPR/Cas system-associated exonuclease Cas4 (RecB family)
MPSDRSRTGSDWVSASEVAEYAYCPRAWWYRGHPPPDGPDPRSLRSAEAGRAFHHRSLRAEARRDRWAGALAAAAILSVVAIALLLRFGGWFG